MSKLSNFIKSSKRIFLISKKPSSKEYWTMAKIVGIGMIVIGVIGYLIRLMMNVISGYI
jgi:protein transport protein SEC61 subunit gamma and related proteins